MPNTDITAKEDEILTRLSESNSVANLHILSYRQYITNAIQTKDSIYENHLALTDTNILEAETAEIKHVTSNKTYLFSTLTSKDKAAQSLQDLLDLSMLLLATDVSQTWQMHTYQMAFGEQVISNLVIHNDKQPHLIYLATPVAADLCSENVIGKNENPNFYNLSQICYLEKLEQPVDTYLRQIVKLDNSLNEKTLKKVLKQLFTKNLKLVKKACHKKDLRSECSAHLENHPTCFLLDLNWLTNNADYSMRADFKKIEYLSKETRAVLDYLAASL